MGRNTRYEIIWAAINLMSENGYKAMTMRQVAQAVGIQPGSLVNYFERKEDLLDGVLEFIDDYIKIPELDQKIISNLLRTHTPAEILQLHFDYHTGEDQETLIKLHRLLCRNQYQHEKVQEAAYRIFIQYQKDTITNTLTLLEQAGAIPPGDHRTVAFVWAAATRAIGVLATQDPELAKLEEYFGIMKFCIEAAVHGVIPVTQEQLGEPEVGRWHAPDLTYAGTKARILETAFHLFSRDGCENVTLRDIAGAVGIKASSLYNYYSSKGQLIAQVLYWLKEGNSPLMIDENDVARAVETGSPAALWQAMSACHIQMDELSERAYRLVFREQYSNLELRSFYWKEVADHIQSLEWGLGHLPHCDSHILATTYIYTMCSMHINATLSESEKADLQADRKRIGCWLVGLILNGYSQPVGPISWSEYTTEALTVS